MGKYPWDQCISDQKKRLRKKGQRTGVDESANKICGYIKAKNR